MAGVITISFQQKEISKKTCECLCSKLDEESDVNLIRDLKFLYSGNSKALKVKEANFLLREIIKSIIITDDELGNEKVSDKTLTTDNENKSENEDSEDESNTETDSEDILNGTIKQKLKLSLYFSD